MPSDEDLMLAAGRGDLAAFEEIVVRHQASAWKTACEPRDPSPSQADLLSARERDREVRKALHGLPDRQRIAVVLRYYEGLGYRDIARAMGVSEKAVERLLARARASLQALLDDSARK